MAVLLAHRSGLALFRGYDDMDQLGRLLLPGHRLVKEASYNGLSVGVFASQEQQ
jgi:hypothetical protein